MRRGIVAVALCAVVAGLIAAPAVTRDRAASALPSKPSRVLLIVLDGMRPDYIDRFQLPNLLALRKSGVNFPNSWTGYMSSITVISHNAIASGKLPKHQGWSDEIYRDVDNVLVGGANSLYVMSSAGCGDFATLVNAAGYKKLQDYLDTLETDSDARFISIAQKDRSACGVGQPADLNDVVIGMSRLGSGAAIECDGITQRWRFPRGVNVPADIAAPCSKYYVDSLNTYGTADVFPSRLYPLDGHRFVPGFDPNRQGGDVWSTDLAIDMMRRDLTLSADERWRGMFVGLGGPDKMAHMWGPDDSVSGNPVDDMIHLPGELKTADEQVGRLVQELKDEGIYDDTLIVITADHGMTQADRFYGVDGPPGHGDFNWYYGVETGTKADESYLDPSPAIAALAARIGDNLEFSYQDTHVAVYLKDRSVSKRQEAAEAMRQLPSAVATYYLNGSNDEFVRDWTATSKVSAAEKGWLATNGDLLVNTMAAPYGPDAVALLKDRTTYSVEGDHGGHQRDVQRIPIIFSWPGLKGAAQPKTQIGNVDILPTILNLMDIPFVSGDLDGTAVTLPRR